MRHTAGVVEVLESVAKRITASQRLAWPPVRGAWQGVDELPLPDGWAAYWRESEHLAGTVLIALVRGDASLDIRVEHDAHRPDYGRWEETLRVRHLRVMSRALSQKGSPVVYIAIDDASTTAEVSLQLFMHAWWRGWLQGEERTVLGAIAAAYPAAARRVHAVAGDDALALALLFDPLERGLYTDRGAKAVRGYIASLARAVEGQTVAATRASDAEKRASRLGYRSPSGYYKRLKRGGVPKDEHGRYQVDDRLENDLEKSRSDARLKQAAIRILMERGFAYQAARKQVQRKGPRGVQDAWPRTHKRTHKGMGIGGIRGTPADSD